MAGPGGQEEDGDGEASGSEPSLRCFPVGLEHLTLASGQQRIACFAAANGSVIAAFASGQVIRWYPEEDEASTIDLGRDRVGDISRVFFDPNAVHALIVSASGDTWYLHYNSNQAKPLAKLKNHTVEAVSWDPHPQDKDTKTGDLIVGTMEGQILKVDIDGSKCNVKQLFTFAIGEYMHLAVCGVHRERVINASDSSERVVLFVAAGCGIYAFANKTLDMLFDKYQGEGAVNRAMIYEVPRDSPHGELHVDTACVGATSSKVLFWLTGVGVLTATINNPIEADGLVLEAPPGLIPFPPNPKAPQHRSGDTLIASLLPPSPPPPPLSMALTAFHVVFIFEDRWVAVSRVTHEVIHQEDWAVPNHGNLRCLTRDACGERLYMCSENHFFEVSIDFEDHNVWSLLLRHEQFEEALAACRRDSHRLIVLSRHADSLFRSGKLQASAKRFAEAAGVPFEHVALRFLRGDRKAALLEFLKSRLRRCEPEDKVQRALLGVWAVEISLANLNDLRIRIQTDKRAALQTAYENARLRLQDLLKDCRDVDVPRIICHLLQSHGWLDHLVYFSEARRDYETVIMHQVMGRDCAGAIQKMTDFPAPGVGEDLIVRFAPVLFGAEPQAFVSLLLRPQLASVEPLSILPAVYAPNGSTQHRFEAVRWLEHVARNHPALADHGRQSGDAGDASPRLLGDQGGLPRVPSVEDFGDRSPTSQGVTGKAVLSALTVLYACDKAGPGGPAPDGGEEGDRDSAEEVAMRFFAAQEGCALFDPHFALRVCVERRLTLAVVRLYGLMGLYEEAVAVALARGDLELAKLNAFKPNDRRLRQKLWLRIVESQAERPACDVEAIVDLIRESQELSVVDALPYLNDSMLVDSLKPELCGYLESYEMQMVTLRQEMDDHRKALSSFKEDLRHAEDRTVTVERTRVCEICGAPAVNEQFFVFACGHCFHEACAQALVTPTLDNSSKEQLFALEARRVEHAAASAGGSSAPGGLLSDAALAEVEEEIASILADDCPLCGRLMVQALRRPFVDAFEQAELDSWDIEDDDDD